MYKLRGIIGFYLTVAVLLTVALMPFEKNLVPVEIFSDIEDSTVCEEESLAFLESDEPTAVESVNIGGEDSSFTDTVLYEESTFVNQNGDFAEDEKVSENIAESVTAEHISESEITEAVEKDLSEEAVSEDIVLTGTMMKPLHNSYAPANKENVYQLYFYSENTGALASADSVNVYTFSLESRSVFQYVFSHKEIIGTAGWNISLYGEYYLNGTDGETGYRLLNTLITEPSATKQSSVKLGLLSGNYRLVVSKGVAYTPDSYSIDVISDEGSEFEIECNDNIYRYTSLYSSVPVMGSASYFTDRQDEDWYMFRQYEDGFAQLKFEHPAVNDKTTVCWQIILYSENGTALYSVNSLFTDEIVRSGAIGLPKGNYYVLVRNRVYTDITYTLTLSRADDVSYEIEKNDTKETATAISVNSTVTGSVAQRLSGIDRDYFKFTLDDKGIVMLEFAHQASAEDKNGWNFVLTDETGMILYKGISAWSDDVTASSHIGLPKGTYYVLVDSDNLYLNSSDYYLTVSFMESDEWETEPNNSFELADVINRNVTVTGLIADCGTADYDYYSFTLDGQSDISVIFEHELLQEDKNIFTFTLYDGEFNPIAATVGEDSGLKSVNVSSADERVQADFSALSAGTYYVKVSSGIYYNSIMYYLYYTL